MYQLSFFLGLWPTKNTWNRHMARIRPFFFLDCFTWYTDFSQTSPFVFVVFVFFLANASKNGFHVAKGRRFPFQQSEAMCHCIEISRGRGRGWGRTSGWHFLSISKGAKVADLGLSLSDVKDQPGHFQKQDGDLGFGWIWIYFFPSFFRVFFFPGLVNSCWFALIICDERKAALSYIASCRSHFHLGKWYPHLIFTTFLAFI